ncbi:alpha/beta hydrolase [Brucella anthropi]|uniref:Alpha/beta hydrolase fold-3 domain protein n=1 Tax=Brucella anthropi (strain ATCC 49188 / DSM 6882 / CCUG 24695 / JCM 21032 / LMG 3331 / NBRC 15819 / NCTC 12168 / Alc 37) TaxID=439375 RepID=A6X2Y3_BRUA4|nr:alpha/beta hydrolase [Brucella anthropi]ABS15587.1 Alpha/beta hydrolase fold-3 domain protein [Brucella anthropi ATCC 49188]AIK42198.1 alpha/beta hydrolase fold family protein [Brucella anthropi]MDH0368765.1 alpha/beta hydrolase [Brucella anthropi]SUB44547.1 acetyl esterase [Brucella anthropi]
MCEKFTVETLQVHGQLHGQAHGQTGNSTCTARIYKGAKLLSPPPVVLHLHGGAFSVNCLGDCERVAETLAEAGAVVVSPEYSSACLNPFPAALEIAYSILSSMRARCPELAHKKSMLFVAGEEAGGNIAAGVALMARDQYLTELKGQILLSPMLDPCLATASFRKYCPESAVQTMSDGWQHYLGECAGFTHPYAAPALCTRLAGLAPTLLVTSAQCPMRDETQAYAERLRQAGVKVQSHVLPGKAGWIAENKVASTDWSPQEHKLIDLFSDFFRQAGAKPIAA